MQRALSTALTALPLAATLVGCTPTGKDSHTEVFKTAADVGAERRERLMQAHKELALSVLRFARPDVEAKAEKGSTVTVSADGVTRAIDLDPIEAQMAAESNRERAILRRYLEDQLRPFDLDRVRALGFEKCRQYVRFRLASAKDVDAAQKEAGESPLRKAEVLPGLYRLTVVERPNATTAVTEDVLKSWGSPADAVDAAAEQALRAKLSQAGDKLFETVTYSSFGRAGTLKADAEVVLLPEFLTTVRAAWKTDDELVMVMAGRENVQFAESRQATVLRIVAPQWKQLLASLPDPLYNLLLLRSADKLAPYVYQQPDTRPAAATKPTTKPEPYIVR